MQKQPLAFPELHSFVLLFVFCGGFYGFSAFADPPAPRPASYNSRLKLCEYQPGVDRSEFDPAKNNNKPYVELRFGEYERMGLAPKNSLSEGHHLLDPSGTGLMRERRTYFEVLKRAAFEACAIKILSAQQMAQYNLAAAKLESNPRDKTAYTEAVRLHTLWTDHETKLVKNLSGHLDGMPDNRDKPGLIGDFNKVGKNNFAYLESHKTQIYEKAKNHVFFEKLKGESYAIWGARNFDANPIKDPSNDVKGNDGLFAQILSQLDRERDSAMVRLSQTTEAAKTLAAREKDMGSITKADPVAVKKEDQNIPIPKRNPRKVAAAEEADKKEEPKADEPINPAEEEEESGPQPEEASAETDDDAGKEETPGRVPSATPSTSDDDTCNTASPYFNQEMCAKGEGTLRGVVFTAPIGAGNRDAGVNDDPARAEIDPPPANNNPAPRPSSANFIAQNKSWLLLGGAGAAGYFGWRHIDKQNDKAAKEEAEKWKMIDDVEKARIAAEAANRETASNTTSTSTSTLTTAPESTTTGTATQGARLLVENVPSGSYAVGSTLPAITVRIIDHNNQQTMDSNSDIGVGCAEPDPCGLTGTVVLNTNSGTVVFSDLKFMAAHSSVKLKFTAQGFSTQTMVKAFKVTGGTSSSTTTTGTTASTSTNTSTNSNRE